MAKLSHIEDVEQRREQEAARAAAQKAEVTPAAQEQPEPKKREAAPVAKSAADAEEAFHGIDASEKMGSGQKVLIVAAVLVTLAAILYIVNSWLHFI